MGNREYYARPGRQIIIVLRENYTFRIPTVHRQQVASTYAYKMHPWYT